MADVLIVGGGVIGLSLAWELAKRGRRVRVLERGQPGREASWAGAGMLPPASRRRAVHPLDQLHALSHELHPRWAAELREETGIDNGFRRCGAIYLARRPGEQASLVAMAEQWRDEDIRVERLSPATLGEIEPSIASTPSAARIRAAFLLPDEAQIRNPRHIKALAAACEARGVEITVEAQSEGFEVAAGRIRGVRTSQALIEADQVCLCAGAWTRFLLEQLGVANGIEPVRGQVVLFRGRSAPLKHIINEGQRYLVPRDDGRVLAGSTCEEVGYDKRTTEEGIQGLIQFAIDLAPFLADAEVERTWAGLRPGVFDGMPYLGRIPGLENAFVAAGHFRNGLHLSPATAVEMAKLLCGEPNEIDLSALHVGRRRDFD